MRLEIDKLYTVNVFFCGSCSLNLGRHFLYYRGVFVNAIGGVMFRFSSSLDNDAIYYNLFIYSDFFSIVEGT